MKCFSHSFHSKETATQHKRGLEALEVVCVRDSEKSGENGWKSLTVLLSRVSWMALMEAEESQTQNRKDCSPGFSLLVSFMST